MFAASKSGRSSGAAPTPTTDASFAYVPLLLETTGTNGQQNNTFLDSSTNAFTITRNGTPTQGSITPYWPNGQWSNLFSSASDGLTFSASAAFVVTGGAFTIEFWAYPTSGSNFDTIIDGGMGSGFGITRRAGTNQLVWQTGAGQIEVGTFLLNQWSHIVANYTGTGSVNLYINGVSVSAAGAVPTNTGTIALYVGKYSLGQPFAGYISNVRIVKGSAVYTNGSTITVPTAPLTPVTNTQLLTCYSNRFVDANTATTAKTLTVTGTPTVQAFQPFSPAASYSAATYAGSGYFNGSAQFLTAPSPSGSLGTGDFTVQCWIYCTGNPAAYSTILSNYSLATGTAFAIFSNFNSNSKITLFAGGSSLPDASNIVFNAWTHVAAVRRSGVVTLYINGVSQGTISYSGSSSGDGIARFGCAGDNTSGTNFQGYISNSSWVIGTAVYTGNFTPPTLAPLTTAGSTSAASYPSTTNVNTSFASSNTSLLLNMANAGIYDAAAQNNMTTVGDAQASTTQSKWSPTSMKYDGTGDWLTAVDGPQLQLGTGDFTIDGWVYLSAVGVVYGILSKGTATTGWSVNVTVLNKLQFSYTASNLTGTTTLATGTWYYFAVVRSGSATGNLKLYLNGSVEATSGGAVTDNFNQTSILYVGADRVGATPLNGYLQDVRITKAARTITTPTAAFPTR